MHSLAEQKCEPCHGGTPKLDETKIAELQEQLQNWVVEDNQKLRKSVKTKNFVESLELANKIGEVAEAEGHHPDLLVRWGELGIELWTHAIGGLSEADFVMAAKIDRLMPNAAPA